MSLKKGSLREIMLRDKVDIHNMKEFLMTIGKYRFTERDFQRDLIITPYMGWHGRTAGVVLCIEGSPPKGTIVFLKEPYSLILITSGGSISRKNIYQHKEIYNYVRDFITTKKIEL